MDLSPERRTESGERRTRTLHPSAPISGVGEVSLELGRDRGSAVPCRAVPCWVDGLKVDGRGRVERGGGRDGDKQTARPVGPELQLLPGLPPLGRSVAVTGCVAALALLCVFRGVDADATFGRPVLETRRTAATSPAGNLI